MPEGKKKGSLQPKIIKNAKGTPFLFPDALELRMIFFHGRCEVASTAIRHSPRVFELAPLIVAAPACLRSGRKGISDLEGTVGIFIENLRRVFGSRGGEPGAPIGPLLGKRLEL